MPSKSSQRKRVAHEESGLPKSLHVLQLNDRLAHISVEAPAQLALEERGIYFSISVQPGIS
jgi:hypothetical protein